MQPRPLSLSAAAVTVAGLVLAIASFAPWIEGVGESNAFAEGRHGWVFLGAGVILVFTSVAARDRFPVHLLWLALALGTGLLAMVDLRALRDGVEAERQRRGFSGDVSVGPYLVLVGAAVVLGGALVSLRRRPEGELSRER